MNRGKLQKKLTCFIKTHTGLIFINQFAFPGNHQMLEEKKNFELIGFRSRFLLTGKIVNKKSCKTPQCVIVKDNEINEQQHEI